MIVTNEKANPVKTGDAKLWVCSHTSGYDCQVSELMMNPNQHKERKTSTLLRGLLNTHDLGLFFERHAPDLDLPTFTAYLNSLCSLARFVPEQVIKNAGIERCYGHQLFNGTRKPSRDKVIQLAFGLQLDLAETQKLLQVAQKSALYPKIKRDAAIIYCLDHHKDFIETQIVFESLGITLLGGE